MKYIKLTDDIKTAMRSKFDELINSIRVADSNLTVKLDTKDLINTEGVEMPTIVIEEKASTKLWAYVALCDKEIGWHGTVVREGNTFRITDVFLFPQTVTAATVTTDDDEYSTWILSQPDEVFNQMRFHGHSHVNMTTGASGVDVAYQQNLLRDVQDFYIFGIFNKRYDMNFCIYDMQTNFLYEKEDIEVQDFCTLYDEAITEEMKAYVRTVTPVTTYKATPPVAGSQTTYSYHQTHLSEVGQQEEENKYGKDWWEKHYGQY